MADPKKAPAAAPKSAPAPTTPPAETNGEAPVKAKRQKTVWTKVFPTPEAAVAEAKSRTKGPRRAFTCTFGDKVLHVVGHNEGRAGGIAFEEIGGKVEEIGRATKQKVVGVDGVLAAIAALPADQQEAIKKAMEAMNAKK